MQKGIIYKVENNINNKIYIGQTIKFLNERRIKHYHSANKDIYFYRALLKYPKQVWNWQTICSIEAPTRLLLKEYLDMAEKMYIEQYNTKGLKGYNLTNGGGGILGYSHSEETKQKISSSEKGKSASKITLWKMSKANKGKRLSQETKQKISRALLGERNPNYGKHLSEITKQKISQALRGNHPSNKTCQKISESNKGRVVSAETRQKIGDAQKGNKSHLYGTHLSEETRRKISESNKGRVVSKITREK